MQSNAAEEIKALTKKINLSWAEGHPENLKDYFHEDMMIVSPELKILGKGRDECIKSYKDFITQATINKYSESEPEIHLFDNTAVASYDYEFAWEMKGELHEETGKDLYVFTYADNKWLAVWRKLIPVTTN